MACEWRFDHTRADQTRAIGDDPSSVLSTAFLLWMDQRDMNYLENPSKLAGFLTAHSDLTHRELAGLLGTFEFDPAPESDRFTFIFGGRYVEVKRLMKAP